MELRRRFGPPAAVGDRRRSVGLECRLVLQLPSSPAQAPERAWVTLD